MRSGKQSSNIVCPDCEEVLDFQGAMPKEGQIFQCPYCEAMLEVISIRPFRLALAEEDEFEDEWEDDEEYDEDYDEDYDGEDDDY